MAKDFRSFSEGTLKAKLSSLKSSGEDSQFYLQKELHANFKKINVPTIQIDIVSVNNITRPV